MTAPDHATSHSKNTLRERGHPYMRFDPGRMLARVAPSRLAIAFSRAPGFAAIFKGGVCLPKPEIGATDIAAGFIHWAWRLLGAGMKPVCYLTRLDRNPRREFRKREIFLFFSLVTL
jgi:hypothetical protein